MGRSSASEDNSRSSGFAWWLKQTDMFGFTPEYEVTSSKTWVGVALSLICTTFLTFYIAISTREYVTRPPELVKQGTLDLPIEKDEIAFPPPELGLNIKYELWNGTHTTRHNVNKTDKYFRMQFTHEIIQEQDSIPRIETVLPMVPCGFGSSSSPAVCPDPQSLEGKNIQGHYATQQYEFIKIEALKCMGKDHCAPIEEINEIIRSGSVECQVYLTSQNFEAGQYHSTGEGLVVRDITWRWYATPLYEVKVELYMRAHQISHEERYVGSPPLPEREVFLMSYDRAEVTHQPIMQPEFDADMLTWYVRLAYDMDLEEVSYWKPSILHLFGPWGAMASFLTSFGTIATAYNRWRFTKKFEKSTKDTRRKAKLHAKLAMAMQLSKSDESTSKAYRVVQSKFDDQIVDSDIRLFDANHFDDHGRLRITPEELRFPATAFGELRRIAIMKHMQNIRSATIISEWYLRILLKRDKIKNKDRRKALVRELSYTLLRNSEKDLMIQHREEIEKEEEMMRSTKSRSSRRGRNHRLDRQGGESNHSK